LIIERSSRLNTESALRYLTYFLLCCLGVTCLLSIYIFFSEKEVVIKQSSVYLKQTPSINEQYALIGTGPLSLNTENFLGRIPNLSREIKLLARNTRPDKGSQRDEVLLALKSSGDELTVGDGQKVYLMAAKKDHITSLPLHFSREPTPLWFIPLVIGSEEISVEVGMKIVEEDGTEKEERTHFTLENASTGQEKVKENSSAFQTLASARFWGTDLLMQRYGGEELREVKEKQMIEFLHPNSSFCYVAPGDYLTWLDGKWQVSALSQIKPEAPLAHVKALQGRSLEIEAWDEKGFFPLRVKLAQQLVPKIMYKPDSLPTAFRLRTSSQVTCVLGKRRMILKQGDWLFKTSTGWHILKRLEEIEDCLQHKIKGELFIFDHLEKEEGRILLRGTLFDEMRTQMQPIEIPIVGSKKNNRRQHKKKNVLSKKNVISSSS
jgi:hypothetical protein